MILKLKGGNGSMIHEIDTNTVLKFPLPPSGDAAVYVQYGKTTKVIIIDREEWHKLFEAMNAAR